MKRLNLKQGEAAWLAHRATARNASDAAAMLGIHPQKTRSQLLHERHTGLAREHSQFVQDRVLAAGHAVEAKKRAVAEAIIGEDLYPVVGSEIVDGIELSASFDGLKLNRDTNWECKSLNDELRAALPMPGPDGNDATNLPKYHRVQMQQQTMVGGCARVLFTASDGQDDDRHCWFYRDAELAQEIIAGWIQFDIDLAAYEPPAAAAPLPTCRAPESLPALLITVRGEVTDSNLADFKEVALSAIRSVNRDLKNDQDFADAEKAVKWCDDIEKRVAGAKQHALSQTATIDTLFKTMDDISAEARQVRLDLEKLVKARKVSLKTEMLTEAQTALGDHIRSLNSRLGRDYMPHVPVDFAGAIASKRNFDSMRAALDATLANAKIAANATADKIDANLKVLREQGKDHGFLFHDVSQIVLKAPDDLQALVKLRISEHQAEVARKDQETKDRLQREANEAAEKRTAMLMQEVEGIQQQVIIASQGRAGVRKGGTIDCIRDTLAETEAWPVLAEHFGGLTAMAQAEKEKAITEIRALLVDAEARELQEKQRREEQNAASAAAMQGIAGARQEDSLPAPILDAMEGVATNLIADLAVGRAAATSANVVPMRAAAPAPAPAAAPATPPTMKLGDLNALLSPIALTAEGLVKLGFPHAATDKSAKLYHARDLTNICAALHDLLDRVQAKQAA